MLVEVKHKETGKTSLITPHAYNLAKKRYTFIRNVNDNDANLHGAQPIQEFKESESPNQKPQTPEQPVEKESGAAHAVSNPVVIETAPVKPGRKPKNQLSSQSEAAEV
jgi:hypothetical protein